MPTILRVKNLRFFFYSSEHDPPHVHVSIGQSTVYPHAKIELLNLEVISVRGFTKSDVKKILHVTSIYREHMLEAWEDYFAEEE